MKHHLVVKLREPLRTTVPIPDWERFITDKSVTVESFVPAVDAILHRAGRSFFVTHEYRPADGDRDRDGDGNRDRDGARHGEWGWDEVERHHGLDRTYRLVFADDTTPLSATVLAEVAAVPVVESCHQLQVARAELPPPGSPTPGEQTPRSDGLSRPTSLTGERRADLIGLPFAHALTRGRPDVLVAVLDTGVQADHPEIRGKVAAQADFVDLAGLDTSSFVGDFLGVDQLAHDELGHGTHVAGIVAAEGHQMDVGIAPDCRLMAVRVLATLAEPGPGARDGWDGQVSQGSQASQAPRLQGAGIVDNINAAVKWAVDHGAAVINMSLGIRHTGGGLPHEDVIRYAVGRGVTVVAASGNDGTNTKYYPGALPGVVAVGAVDDTGRVADFSSWGAPISVVAPGVNVLSAYAHGRYATASGTSQAAPVVAGAVALLKSCARDHGRDLDSAAVARLLRETSDRLDHRVRSPQAGHGLVNLTDACKWLLGSFDQPRPVRVPRAA